MKTVTISGADAAQLLLDSGLLGEINRLVLHPREIAAKLAAYDAQHPLKGIGAGVINPRGIKKE